MAPATVLGLIVVGCLVPLNALMQRHRPADLGLYPDGAPESPPAVVGPAAVPVTVSWTLRRAIITRRFEYLYAGQYLDAASEPHEPVENGHVFAGRVGMAEAREFVVSDVVPPLTQLVDHQADIRHRKKLILGAMGDIDRQLARLGTALMWP